MPATSPEPIRWRILAGVAARLDTMKTPGGVYYQAPALVTLSLLAPSQYSAFPVFGVTRSSGSRLDLVSKPGLFSHDFLLEVGCYAISTDEAVPVGYVLERHWDDHLRCLREDRTLGGIVKELEPVGELETDEGGTDPRGWWFQPWRAVASQALGT